MKKLSIDAMREAAAAYGGLCLSESYRDSLSKLEWQCARGHRWFAVPHSVRQGHWCRRCAYDRLRKTVDDMRALAARHNGALLSDAYVNSQTPLRWRCAIGHEWDAIPNAVRQGTWCPHCD